jgi:hypothetical protein
MIKKKVKKEIHKEVFREDVSDLEIAKKMLKIYQSAQDRKLKFDLSFESVKKLLSYQTCYYTNKPFEAEGVFARSFDRIDSAEGYVENNVVACTVDINGKKSNLSFDEIECLYNKLCVLKSKKTPPAAKKAPVIKAQKSPAETEQPEPEKPQEPEEPEYKATSE